MHYELRNAHYEVGSCNEARYELRNGGVYRGPKQPCLSAQSVTAVGREKCDSGVYSVLEPL